MAPVMIKMLIDKDLHKIGEELFLQRDTLLIGAY